MNYYKKYIKYKNKYLYLKQNGGNLDNIKKLLPTIFSASRIKIKNPIEIIITKSYKEGNFFYFCSKYLNNDNQSIINYINATTREQILKIDTSINTDEIKNNLDYVIIVDEKNEELDMYNINLFVGTFNLENDSNYIYKVTWYIKNIIKNYNLGIFSKSIIYLAIAVYNQLGFYIPEFIKEQLATNLELKYTIIIVADEYVDNTSWEHNIKKNKIVEEFKKENPDLSDRILFIHIMMKIPDINNIEANIINNIKNIDDNNYCYVGYESCGTLFNKIELRDRIIESQYNKNKNIDNIIFVGCDGVFLGEKYIKKSELITVDNALILQLFS